MDSELLSRAIRYAIDRHASAEVLRYQLGFQQQMIDALPTPMFYTDATLMVLGCNQAFEALTGLSRHEVLGGFVYEVLPGGLAQAFDEDDLGAAGTAVGSDVSFENADGTKRSGTVTHTAFTDTDGKVAGLHKQLSPSDDGNFISPVPVRLALEVPGGFTDRHGIKVGDPVVFQRGGL